MAPKTRRKGGSPPSTQSSDLSAANPASTQASAQAPEPSSTVPVDTTESLLREIDGELARMPQAVRLSSLFHRLKSELLTGLMKSIHRVDSRLPSPSRSYASVAAATTPAPEKPVPLKDLREIQINRRDLSPEEATRTTNGLTNTLRERFAQLNLGTILAIRELPSRDLVLVTDTPDTKTKAMARQREWLSVVGDRAIVRPQRYTVMAHGIPVTAFDNSEQERGLEALHAMNPNAISRGARILRFHWRQRALKLNKQYSSLLLDVESAQGANALIREGLVFNGEIKEIELFEPECLITRCYKCQRYGHNAKYCQAAERCSLCAAPGHARNLCPVASQDAQRACVNCTGRHASGSSQCPQQQAQAQKAQKAMLSKARFFKEPASEATSATAPISPIRVIGPSSNTPSNPKKRRTAVSTNAYGPVDTEALQSFTTALSGIKPSLPACVGRSQPAATDAPPATTTTGEPHAPAETHNADGSSTPDPTSQPQDIEMDNSTTNKSQ